MSVKKPAVVDDSIMNPVGVPVLMGTQQYFIRELPIARLKRFKSVFLEFFESMSTLLQDGDLTNSNVMTALFGLLEDKPGELLEIIIPGFDVATLDDEDTGVTVPQLKNAIDLSITANGLDVIRRAVPFLASVGTQTAKTSILNSVIRKMENEGNDTEKTN